MELSNDVIENMKTHFHDILRENKLKLVAYFDNELYYINKIDGVFDIYTINNSEYSFTEVVTLSDYEKQSYICDNMTLGYSKTYIFSKDHVEILYTYHDKEDDLISVLFYSTTFNKIFYDYYSPSDFDTYFIIDYTKENLELLDNL